MQSSEWRSEAFDGESVAIESVHSCHGRQPTTLDVRDDTSLSDDIMTTITATMPIMLEIIFGQSIDDLFKIENGN